MNSPDQGPQGLPYALQKQQAQDGQGAPQEEAPHVPKELIEWLEARHPEPDFHPLEPHTLTSYRAAQRALVRELRTIYDRQE